jgi:hypothetical protein
MEDHTEDFFAEDPLAMDDREPAELGASDEDMDDVAEQGDEEYIDEDLVEEPGERQAPDSRLPLHKPSNLSPEICHKECGMKLMKSRLGTHLYAEQTGELVFLGPTESYTLGFKQEPNGPRFAAFVDHPAWPAPRFVKSFLRYALHEREVGPHVLTNAGMSWSQMGGGS